MTTPATYKHWRDRTHGPSGWSQAIRERDHNICQINGPKCTHTATEADHIIPLSQGGTWSMSNGRAVCHNCHVEKTAEEIRYGKNKWRRKETRHPSEI